MPSELHPDVIRLLQRSGGQIIVVCPILVAFVLLEGVIYIEQCEMIAIRMSELGFSLIGFPSRVVGPNENIRDRQHSRQTQDLVTAPELGTADQHFRELRVKREFCHDFAKRC